MEKLKNIFTWILVIFALISIGFLLGKNSVKKNNQIEHSLKITEDKDIVAVYYLHTTFRCVTCNTIEQMTKDLINNSYQEELKKGKLIWREENFQENEDLAEKFQISSSCVVVAYISDGIIKDYKRLDEVWNLIKNPENFNQYISNAIEEQLNRLGGKI